MANHLNTDKKTTAISLLCEGSSIRSIERITGIHRDTVMRLGVRVGAGCRELMDSMFHGLRSEQIQVDEMWGFIGAKASTVRRKNLGNDYGDVWVWIAIDADSKLVLTHVVGRRDQEMDEQEARTGRTDNGQRHPTG